MNAKIATYDSKNGQGILLTEDNSKVQFSINDWSDFSTLPEVGMLVSINEDNTIKIATEIPQGELLQFPILPNDLSIGQQITNWTGDAFIKAYYIHSENTFTGISGGELQLVLHTHGIKIMKSYIDIGFSIHNSQIMSMKHISDGELAQVDKSIIGRAIAGGLIMGPVGAVVGGMTGMKTQESYVEKHLLIINFWDVNTKSAQTLLFRGQKNNVEQFVNRYYAEQKINQSENRKADSSLPIFPLIFLIVTVIMVILAISSIFN